MCRLRATPYRCDPPLLAAADALILLQPDAITKEVFLQARIPLLPKTVAQDLCVRASDKTLVLVLDYLLNVYSLKDAETGCARVSIDLLPLKGATYRAAVGMLNKLGEWNITTDKFVLDYTLMFLHQCAKQAATNDDARWGKYLNFASRVVSQDAQSCENIVSHEKGRCPSMRQGDAQPRENLGPWHSISVEEYDTHTWLSDTCSWVFYGNCASLHQVCDDDSDEDVKLTYIALWVGRLTLCPEVLRCWRPEWLTQAGMCPGTYRDVGRLPASSAFSGVTTTARGHHASLCYAPAMTEERLAGILAKLNTMLSEWRESRHRPHDTIDEWLRTRRWWVREKGHT